MADVDITQLGKMLNPEQNIAKLKRADSDGSDAVRDERGRPLAESNMAGLIKSKHRMTAQEVIKSFNDTLEVQGRVEKNAKKIISQIADKIWKKKFGNLDEQEKAVARRMKNTGELKVRMHNVKTVNMKLAELSKDIGLTADEVHLIVFTSLDHDYPTNGAT